MPVRCVELAVLGAGPAGLTAAWRAARRGLRVVVLEAAPQVGGMAASLDVAGTRVDFGSHRLHPATDPQVLGDLRHLLGEDLQDRTRHGRLRIGGQWLSFPLRATELATSLPRPLVAAVARDVVTSPLRRGGDASYEGALRRNLGPTLYDLVYGPYARKLWGLDGAEVDVEQARRRVSADTAWKLAVRVVGTSRGTGRGTRFYYPRKGFGQIVESLAVEARRHGAEVLTGARISAVHARPDGVDVRWDGGELHARHAFSTLPVAVLGRIARPAPSAQAVQDAAGVQFRAMVLVYLVHEGGRWTPYDAHYLPGPGTPVSRVSEPANYRDDPHERTDRSVLCAEIPCSAGDALWSADDGALAELVQAGLAASGLPPVRLPADGGVVVRRLPRVYPVYARGYADRLAGLNAWADGLTTVTTFGRLGLFVHDNTHHAMRMAYDAVDALRADGSFDAATWAAARERFAAHVVED